jgi:rhamnosyltransferase
MSCLVLMAVYKPANSFKEQLRSIACQDQIMVSIKISLDSPDSLSSIRGDVDQIVREGHIAESQITIVSGPQKKSPAANFFSLIMGASGSYDYYAFSDQDDIWKPSKLLSAVQCLESRDCDCYSSELLVWLDDTPQEQARFTRRFSSKKNHFGYLFAESAGCTYVLSQSAFLSLKQRLILVHSKGLLDCIFSHDLFSSVYLQSQGFRWVHDPNSFIYYRQHLVNEWGANAFSLKGIVSRIRLMYDGRYLALLYLAWLKCPTASDVYPPLQCLLKFDLLSRLRLLYFFNGSVSLTDPRLLGIFFTIFFSRTMWLSKCKSSIK